MTQNAKRNLWNAAFKDINGNWYSSAGCRLAVGTQMCPFKILLFALSLSRYHYLKSLWRGPCCWHSCGLGVNAQDVPRCCQPAQQLHKNTQSGKMISRMCGDSLRNVFLTGALENVYVMGWDHNLDKSFYLICSLQIQLVNVYLVGLCFHWKSVIFLVKLQPLWPARIWNRIFLVNIWLCQKGAVVQLPWLTHCCWVKEQSTLTRSFPQSQASETTPDKGSQSRLLWQQRSRDAAEILSSVLHRCCNGVVVSVTGKPCPVGMREEGKTMWCRD